MACPYTCGRPRPFPAELARALPLSAPCRPRVPQVNNKRMDESAAQEAEARLRGLLAAAGYQAGEGSWYARYNGPGTLDAFRSNEVMVPLVGFELEEGK